MNFNYVVCLNHYLLAIIEIIISELFYQLHFLETSQIP